MKNPTIKFLTILLAIAIHSDASASFKKLSDNSRYVEARTFLGNTISGTFAYMRIGDLQKEPTDKELVRAAYSSDAFFLRNLRHAIQFALARKSDCYARAIQMQPGLAGWMTYIITVDANGHAKSVVAKTNTLASSALDSCMSKALSTLRVMRAPGTSVIIELPLRFEV